MNYLFFLFSKLTDLYKGDKHVQQDPFSYPDGRDCPDCL